MVKPTLMQKFKRVINASNLTPSQCKEKEIGARLSGARAGQLEYSSSDEDDYSTTLGPWCMDNFFTPGRPFSSPVTAASTSVARTDESSHLSSPADSPFLGTEGPIPSRKQHAGVDEDGEASDGLPDLQGPPRIKRDTRVTELECLQEFPCTSWHGAFLLDLNTNMDLNGKDNVEYDADDNWNGVHRYVSPSRSIVESMESFYEAWEKNDTSDTTVVTSNRSGIDRSMLPLQPERTIGSPKIGSLRNVFQIKISKPLQLPKEKRKLNLKQFIRPLSAKETRRSSSTDAAEATRDAKDINSCWLKTASFNEVQEHILLGVPLQSEKKKIRTPPLIGSMFKKSNSIGKDEHPARKLENILNKKRANRRKNTDSMQRIRQILARHKDLLVQMPKHDKKSKMDEAVRFDGLDIVSCGSARKVSYIGQKQKQLSGQRYTLRSMVMDSLWSESGRDPAEIVFEGYSQRGEGSDRWSCRIEHWTDKHARRQAHIWGRGNRPPPSPETKVHDSPRTSKKTYCGEILPNSIFVVQTLEQLKLAHEYAVAPLKVCFYSNWFFMLQILVLILSGLSQRGHINESIVMFQKILRSLKVKYAGGMNHVLASTCHNIAILYTWEGRFEDALNYINKAISVRVNTLGYIHVSVAVSGYSSFLFDVSFYIFLFQFAQMHVPAYIGITR